MMNENKWGIVIVFFIVAYAVFMAWAIRMYKKMDGRPVKAGIVGGGLMPLFSMVAMMLASVIVGSVMSVLLFVSIHRLVTFTLSLIGAALAGAGVGSLVLYLLMKWITHKPKTSG